MIFSNTLLDVAEPAAEFARRLLHEELLDVVPGPVFGAPQDEAWIRLCFARTTDVLQDGLDRLHRVAG